ncbi:MAG TPA: CrcB family protein [Acidimicrobiales bacterium]|jgi:CrcB protein|nr:CrcB family protein [Acidimicrobiales bacterium]
MNDNHHPLGDPLDGIALPRLGFSAAALVAIFIGGAIGTVARFLLDSSHATPSGHFPLTTLVINLSGSLAIGLLVPLVERMQQRIPWGRPFLIVGLLGGWTTYSTLAVDAVQLGRGSHVAIGLAYLAATVAGGVALVVVGDALGRRVVRP